MNRGPRLKKVEIVDGKINFTCLQEACPTGCCGPFGHGERPSRIALTGKCAALENGRCSIHAFKPTICRAYPFQADIAGDLFGITACPGFGSGYTNIEDLSAETTAAKEMRRFLLKGINKQEAEPK
jgi:Fe-S-cluster containining protein